MEGSERFVLPFWVKIDILISNIPTNYVFKVEVTAKRIESKM